MANAAVVGILKALLTCDSSEFTKAMTGASKEVTDLGKKLQSDLEPRQRAVNNLVKEFLGGGEIRRAQEYAEAITAIGGASKLTEQDQQKVNRAINEALDHYRALGAEAPKNLLDIEQATRRLPEPLNQTNTSLDKIWSGLKGAAGLIGVTFTVGAVINFASKVFDTASKIHDMSIALGFSAEGYQRNKFAAEQSGASLEDFTKAAGKLNDALGEGKKSTVEALKAAGLEFSAIRAMKPEDAWVAVADAVGKIEDPLEQARVAQDLFGKNFLVLLPGMIEGYRKLGEGATVMSNETIDRLEKAQDAWGKFWDKITIISGEAIAATMGQTKAQTTAIQNAFIELQHSTPAVQEAWVQAQALGQMMANNTTLAHETEVAWKRLRPVHEDVTLALEKATKITADYTLQLQQATAAVNALTPAQKASIRAGIELGQSTSDITKEMSLAEGVVELYKDRLAEHTKSQEEATRRDKERAEALKNLSSDMLQLTQYQRDQIGVLITSGKSEADIAKAYGYTATQVKQVSEAMKDREDTIKWVLADGLAREKANAAAQISIWQHMEQRANQISKQIANNYFKTLDAQADVNMLAAKRTMEAYDFQVYQIAQWGEAQKRGFRGSVEQTAAYYDAIDALTREKLAAIDPWAAGIDRTFKNLQTNIGQSLISITGGWDEMWAGMKRTAEALGQDIIATVVHTFLDPLLAAIVGKQSAFGKAWAGLFSGITGAGGAAGTVGGAAGAAGTAGGGAAGGGAGAGAFGGAAIFIAEAILPLILGRILNPVLADDPRNIAAAEFYKNADYMGLTPEEYAAIIGGSVPDIPRDHLPPSFAMEAFVARPTMAIVGDAPGGEYVLRPETLQAMISSASAGGGRGGDGAVTHHWNISALDGASVDRVVRSPRFKQSFYQATTDDRQFSNRLVNALGVG